MSTISMVLYDEILSLTLSSRRCVVAMAVMNDCSSAIKALRFWVGATLRQ